MQIVSSIWSSIRSSTMHWPPDGGTKHGGHLKCGVGSGCAVEALRDLMGLDECRTMAEWWRRWAVVPGQGKCERDLIAQPIALQMLTSGGSEGWAHYLTPRSWGSWAGFWWLRQRSVRGSGSPGAAQGPDVS